MRRLSTAAAAALSSALFVPALLACSAVDRALDCGKTALTVAEAADDLQRAVSSATEDPTEARESLDEIDRNLDKISEETEDADVNKAVDSLDSAVQSVRGDIDDGKSPRAAPVEDAADELTQVCTEG